MTAAEAVPLALFAFGELVLLVGYVGALRTGSWRGFATAWWLAGAVAYVGCFLPAFADFKTWCLGTAVVSGLGLWAMASGTWAGYKE